jgi:3-oxoacyl-(acyl-carrier-protein) synthase
MKIAVTGKSAVSSNNADRVLSGLPRRNVTMRLTGSLEILIIAAAGCVLKDAGIIYPVGDSSIGVYIGIDDAVEDLKDEYFVNILNDGVTGVSPLLFPFTSPNALAAQVTIAFDLRGECITMPITKYRNNVIEYAAESIAGGYMKMAIAGTIIIADGQLRPADGRYAAEMFFLEKLEHAQNRMAGIYEVI